MLPLVSQLLLLAAALDRQLLYIHIEQTKLKLLPEARKLLCCCREGHAAPISTTTTTRKGWCPTSTTAATSRSASCRTLCAVTCRICAFCV